MKSEVSGCKVTHELTHLEMGIAMNEVGGNTSQKGDGYIGSKLLVCGRGMTPQKKCEGQILDNIRTYLSQWGPWNMYYYIFQETQISCG